MKYISLETGLTSINFYFNTLFLFLSVLIEQDYSLAHCAIIYFERYHKRSCSHSTSNEVCFFFKKKWMLENSIMLHFLIWKYIVVMTTMQ